ncbi:MAG TPA: nicotinate-nucleotide adenylyltransferase [Geobacteraceae bacterium]|nr:nicotinate-nucleotide adenylyltransferase [Geobacteraceae bacterium]
MRLGIIGGTFNPIHLAHLRIAEEVRDRLTLDRVIFIPAARPPHKEPNDYLVFEHRLAMVELAIEDNPGFSVSSLEEELGGTSYSVHTLTELRSLYPGDELYFIIGSDSYRDISSWYRYAEIFSLSNLAVVERPGAEIADLRSPLPVAMATEFCYDSDALRLTHRSGFSVYYLAGIPLAISSSEIRRLARKGCSLRYLLPEKVAGYIEEKRIYRECT